MCQKNLMILIFLSLVFSVSAQSGNVCSDLVADVTANVPASCDETGRNEICFGNPNILAEPQPDVVDFQFSAVGDIEDVIKLKSLRLGAMDTAGPEWGVTLLRLQTNLPDTLPGENVTFLMFGETELRPADTLVERPATVNASQTVNVRADATMSSATVGSVGSGATITANGITDDGEWVRVELEDGTQGWIAGFLLTVEDIDSLNIVSSGQVVYAPLQAIYFSSGIGENLCNDVPDKGLLIQTPKGAGTINFLINEVSIQVGSTLFVQAIPDDYLVIYVLEGEIEVTAFDVTKTVPEGGFIYVPINADLQATGAPEDVQAYDDTGLENLPIQLLPDEIIIAEPLTEDDLAEFAQCTGTNDAVINARRGPGTEYGNRQIVVNTTSMIEGQAEGTDGFIWYRIGTNGVWWLRSDLVSLSGDCSDLPIITDIPEPPITTQANTTTASSRSSRSFWVTLWFNGRECTLPSEQIQAGDVVTFGFGCCSGSSPEDQALKVQQAGPPVVTVDGNLLSAQVSSRLDFVDNAYHQIASATWTAVSGNHNVTAIWDNVATCNLTVE